VLSFADLRSRADALEQIGRGTHFKSRTTYTY